MRPRKTGLIIGLPILAVVAVVAVVAVLAVLAGTFVSRGSQRTGAAAPPIISVTSATADASLMATVTVTLANVPTGQMTGYAFNLSYSNAGLSRSAGTTGACMFGMSGVPPASTGVSPYSAGCANIPGPGTPTNACSPGPCTLATIVFSCKAGGSFPLTFNPTTAAYGDASSNVVGVAVLNGTVTCAAPPTNTSTPTSTATPTLTPTPTSTACSGACPTPGVSAVIGLETWPCLALVLRFQCASLNIPSSLDAVAARSAGLTPSELLARGSLDGGTTPHVLPSDLASIDVDANQLHERDGTLWVVAFVGSADPVTFTATRGSFIDPFLGAVGASLVCGPSGPDADCGGYAVRGDGVVVARLDALGAARGPGMVMVSQSGVAQSMPFTVVGEPLTISLDAVPSQIETSRDPPIASSLATGVSSGSSTVVVSADILAGRALPADIVIDPVNPPSSERVTVVSKAGGTYTLQTGKLNGSGDFRLSGTAFAHQAGAPAATADTCADQYTAGGLSAALTRPDRTLIIARPKDSDGTIIANAVVTFASSNSQIAEAPFVVAPSMDLGSYGIGAPMVICGGTHPGDATVTVALTTTLPPPFPGLAVDPFAGSDSHIVSLHVAIPCSDFDLNHDGAVGFPDLYALALAYNSAPGDPAWSPASDFIADSEVGFDDLYQLALHYNQTC